MKHRRIALGLCALLTACSAAGSKDSEVVVEPETPEERAAYDAQLGTVSPGGMLEGAMHLRFEPPPSVLDAGDAAPPEDAAANQ